MTVILWSVFSATGNAPAHIRMSIVSMSAVTLPNYRLPFLSLFLQLPVYTIQFMG